MYSINWSLPKRTQRCFNLLINCPDIELNARNSEACGERTAFIVACAIGHKDVVQLMLDHSNSNIDLNARDNEGGTYCIYDGLSRRRY